jgi:hypothetical protein
MTFSGRREDSFRNTEAKVTCRPSLSRSGCPPCITHGERVWLSGAIEGGLRRRTRDLAEGSDGVRPLRLRRKAALTAHSAGAVETSKGIYVFRCLPPIEAAKPRRVRP